MAIPNVRAPPKRQGGWQNKVRFVDRHPVLQHRAGQSLHLLCYCLSVNGQDFQSALCACQCY